jgi:hypothetical protein
MAIAGNNGEHIANGSQSARIAGSALGSTAGRFARVTACGLPDFVDLAFEETPKSRRGRSARHRAVRFLN